MEVIPTTFSSSPHLIAVGGLSGSGKSTLARALAGLCALSGRALLLRSDVERKALLGVAETTRLDASAYTPEMTQRVYEQLSIKAGFGLALQNVVVVDAVFSRPDERDAIEQIARDHQTAFQGFWLHASTRIMLDRVAARKGDASDATPAIVERQRGYDLGPICWHIIDADGTDAATLASARRVLHF